MTVVLVTGGNGMLGRQIVPALVSKGYTARVMSRARQPNELMVGVEWARADLASGEGVARAMHGVDTLIHAASSPFKAMRQVDENGTKLLLDHAREAGVKHVLYVSIVGIERIPLSYYRYKLAAETLVKQSGLPWSILRAAQFHYFIDMLLRSLTRTPLVTVLPADLKAQTVDEKDVASRLCEVVDQGPSICLPDLGGPQVMTLGQMARLQLQARDMSRTLIPLHLPGKVADGFRKGYNTCPDEPLHGTVTWAEWLRKTYQER